MQANVKAHRKKHSQIGERVGHRSAPFSLSHMFNDEIRFCVELVGKSYILPHLEGSWFFFSVNISTFTISFERLQQHQLHVCMECFYYELIHYIVSCSFQTRFLPAFVKWKRVLCDLGEREGERGRELGINQSVVKKTYCRSWNT